MAVNNSQTPHKDQVQMTDRKGDLRAAVLMHWVTFGENGERTR